MTALLAVPADLRAESQNTVSMSTPAGNYPGNSGSLSITQTSGPAASISGTVSDTYAGVRKFTLGTDGAGRYSGLSGETRVGVVFDTFQIFQSILSSNFFSLVSSGNTCPSTTTYTWIKVRFRTPDAVRDPDAASSTSERIGGVITYNSAATSDFTGSSYFDLAGPTLTSTSYEIDRLSAGCSGGNFKTKNVSAAKPWDTYGTAFFGDELFGYISNHGNPTLVVGAPQVTLVDGDFSALYEQVFTGVLTTYATMTNQVRKNIYLYPTDSTGKTFTIRQANNLDDPFDYTDYGTLACTTKNSPANGFCSGTLSLAGVGGSGHAVCQLATPGSQKMLSCAAQSPQYTDALISLMALTPSRSVIAAVPAGAATTATPNPGTPPSLTVTVKNLSGKKVDTMGQPSVVGERPQAPFAYKGTTYPGTGGTCGTELAAYNTCTVVLEYNPSSYSSSAQTFRQEYDNGITTVQGTASVLGMAGISSLAITPGTTSYSTGTNQQFTAVATYADASTQDVSSIVTWASTSSSVAAFNSTGLATFATGSADASATLGGVTSNTLSLTVSPGPSTVDTSTSVTATAYTSSRKVIYDTVNSRHWAFYYNGTAIEYSYSSDGGSTWTSGGTLAYATANFDVTYKALSGTGYVFLVSEANSYDVVLRRGTCGASAITFDSEITYFDGNATSKMFVKPAVAISASNYVWVAAFRDFGDARIARYQATAVVSSNTATGTLSSLGTVQMVGQNLTTYRSVALAPKTTADVYLFVHEGPATRAYENVSGTWKFLYTPSSTTAGNASTWKSEQSAGSVLVRSLAYVSATEIYIAGNFRGLGSLQGTNGIAMWDGSVWSKLGSGLADPTNEYVNTVTASSGNVFIAGSFANFGGNVNADNVARWDKSNSTWYAMGTGVGAEAVALYYDSVGSNLYVGGLFTDGGGNTNCDRICRWNGSAWGSLAVLNNAVYAINSDGTNIFVGGNFTDASSNTLADRIAYWDGSAYRPLGANSPNGTVKAIHIDGSNNLYIGGSFLNAGGNNNCDRICKWNGSAWAAFGTGISSGTVESIAVIGSNVYFAGGSLPYNGVGKYNGSAYSEVGAGTFKGVNNNVMSTTLVGSNLYAVGTFTRVGDEFGYFPIARLDDTTQGWTMFSVYSRFNATIFSVAEDSQGSLYIGGGYTYGGGNTNADYVTKWSPANRYSSLSTGLNAVVYAVATSGTNVYVGGMFSNAGGNANADFFAKWDGSSWSALGTPPASGWVNDILVDGSNIFIAGSFTNFGGVSGATNVALWNGSTWNALGSGLSSEVYVLAGTSSSLYAGGAFADAGGNTTADKLAYWNGSSWTGVPSANLAAGTTTVNALEVDGTNLYIGGTFQTPNTVLGVGTNGVDVPCVVRWNGSAWDMLGTQGCKGYSVMDLKKVGSSIYAVGDFSDLGGNTSADVIALYNGSAWEGVGTSLPYGSSGYEIALGASGNISVIGGTASSAGDGLFVRKEVVPSVGSSSSASEFSIATDSSGNVQLLSLNTSGYPVFDLFNTSTGWASTTTLNSSASTNPCLGINQSNGNRYALWRETNNIKYKVYSSGSWGSATTASGSGTNVHLTCAAVQDADSKFTLLWTEGSGSPYNIKTMRVP